MNKNDIRKTSLYLILIGILFIVMGYFFVKYVDLQKILPFLTLITPEISLYGIGAIKKYIFFFLFFVGIFITISGFLEQKKF